MISASHRLLPDNTQHSQETDIHAPGRTRTHNLSTRADVVLRLRPRGQWDRHLVPLKPKYSPKHPFSDTFSLRFSLNVSNQVSPPHKTKGKIRVLYILIFIFFLLEDLRRQKTQSESRSSGLNEGPSEYEAGVAICSPERPTHFRKDRKRTNVQKNKN